MKTNAHLENLRDYNEWCIFAREAMPLKILFPDRASELELDDEAFSGMKAKLASYRDMRWQSFAKLAMRLKILFPDRASELELDDKAFSGVKAELESYRDKDWWNFALQAMRLKILAAEKVEVTDQGLKITMFQPDFEKEKTKRPERKTF